MKNETILPIGRNKWDVYDENCEISGVQYLTLSNCQYAEQFTCDSGKCVDILNRCNDVGDCKDYSDEKECSLIRIPDRYIKVESPNTKMNIDVNILSIHRIDTTNMVIELTFDSIIRWTDGRLSYANLHNSTGTLVRSKLAQKIWNPLNHIISDNAFIGKVYENRRTRRLFVEPTISALPFKIRQKYEERLWSGHDNHLQVNQRYRIEYECLFNLRKFPFDDQECNIKLQLKMDGNRRLHFLADNSSIMYSGPNVVNEFDIMNVTSRSETGKYSTSFIYTIRMKRNYMSQIISIFFPTWLLWLLAYLTLFINPSNFNNRFMGSITFLLVLVALLGSLSNSLPRTTYFKYIDCWFFWYVTNNILIIAYNVFLDKVQLTNEQVMPIGNAAEANGKSWFGLLLSLKRAQINRKAIMLFPVLTIIFNILYFTLTT